MEKVNIYIKVSGTSGGNSGRLNIAIIVMTFVIVMIVMGTTIDGTIAKKWPNFQELKYKKFLRLKGLSLLKK